MLGQLDQAVDAARRAVVLPTNVTFSVSIEPPDLVVHCDAVLLERVLAQAPGALLSVIG